VTLVQIFKSLGTQRQLLLEPGAGKLIQLADHRAFFKNLSIDVVAEVRERVTYKVRDPFYSAFEIQFLVILDELENISTGTAGKAFVNAQRGIYRHGRGVVIVERAHADVSIIPALFERQELLDDQRDIRLVLEFLDDFVGVERHGTKIVNSG
jgi:hypothetical protein